MRRPAEVGWALPPRYCVLLPLAVVLVGLLLVLQWRSLERDEFGELPDFAAIDHVPSMKRAFFRYMTPIIEHHNDVIRAQRARLKALQQAGPPDELPDDEARWLRQLSVRYELPWQADTPPEGLLAALLLRVDTIPLPLALAQAAKESGWGRSRFAVEGNNLFGQWCYTEGCGIVPANRSTGARHELEVFPSVSEAMRRYMNNLNTHERYREFRALRARLRREDEPMAGLKLARALIYYSERREAYVKEIRSMIRQFRRMLAESSAP
ncbi:MAG TPA: Bax protein [Haliea salexigens]|uniref:Bax protein n=1 Tax=Haliea salexigens TaxID=287487 RepID=A0A3C1KSJ5_9GAMM|nr:Bax protein [Haliea sp.]HAN29483.1 Bax protein [Haliea salexigens]